MVVGGLVISRMNDLMLSRASDLVLAAGVDKSRTTYLLGVKSRESRSAHTKSLAT